MLYSELQKCIVGCDSSARALVILVFIFRSIHSRGEIKNPIICACNIGQKQRQRFTAMINCQDINYKGANRTSTPNDEFLHMIVFFGIDRYAMYGLSLKHSSGLEIS